MKLFGILMLLSAMILFSYYRLAAMEAKKAFLVDSKTYVGNYLLVDYPSTWHHETFIDAHASSVTFYDSESTVHLIMGFWLNPEATDSNANIYPEAEKGSDEASQPRYTEIIRLPNIEQPIELKVYDAAESSTAWPNMLFPTGYAEYVFEVPQKEFRRYFYFSNTLSSENQRAILSTIRLEETGAE